MNTKHIYTALTKYLQEPRLRDLYRTVKSLFIEQDAIGHNWEHVRRDIINAVYIGLEENADMEIVMPAMILHDIGYVTHTQEPEQHPVHGSRECYRFLDAWTREQKDRISSCILKHKGKFPGFEHSEPETPEEQVVCDADQVDKFGWIGFMQMMKVYIEHASKGKEQFKTLTGLARGMKNQKAIRLYTKTGKRMAGERRDPDFSKIAETLETELVFYEGWEERF